MRIKVALAAVLALAGVWTAGRAEASSLQAMPGSVMFVDTGTNATSASQTVTFTNTSMNQVFVSLIQIGGANPMDFSVVNPPGLLMRNSFVTLPLPSISITRPEASTMRYAPPGSFCPE